MITNLKTALQNPRDTRFLKLTIKGDIPSEINLLTNLEELYLEGEFQEFNLDINSFSKLRTLSIKSSVLKSFPSTALKCPSLRNLKVLGGLFENLILPLEVLSHLEFLTLKNTKLAHLPMEISQFGDITEMNLSQNKLVDLPASIIELKKLKRLNIDNNQFSVFPDIIKKCEGLKYLSCDGNFFSEEEKQRIQREFNLTI